MLRRDVGAGLPALRAFEEADADELFALVERSRAHLAPWLPWIEHHTTRADSLGFIRRAADELAAGTDAELAIVEHERIVGAVALVAIDQDAGTCRCGYWLAPEREGHGIVTRAMSLLIDHAFAERGLRRLELRVAPGNARSRRVAERLGFRCTGPIDGTELFGERWSDQLQYVLLAHEWAALRRTS